MGDSGGTGGSGAFPLTVGGRRSIGCKRLIL